MAAFVARRQRESRLEDNRHADALRASVPELAARLMALGAERVWLFGSLAWGAPDVHADIDLAVEGLPPSRYFRAVGELLCAAPAPVDLVELERLPPEFAARIRGDGMLVSGSES